MGMTERSSGGEHHHNCYQTKMRERAMSGTGEAHVRWCRCGHAEAAHMDGGTGPCNCDRDDWTGTMCDCRSFRERCGDDPTNCAACRTGTYWLPAPVSSGEAGTGEAMQDSVNRLIGNAHMAAAGGIRQSAPASSASADAATTGEIGENKALREALAREWEALRPSEVSRRWDALMWRIRELSTSSGPLSKDPPDTSWVTEVDAQSGLPAPEAGEAGAVEACSDCGHIHTPEGCTGPHTPSDRWAGVSPSGCDCRSFGERCGDDANNCAACRTGRYWIPAPVVAPSAEEWS